MDLSIQIDNNTFLFQDYTKLCLCGYMNIPYDSLDHGKSRHILNKYHKLLIIVVCGKYFAVAAEGEKLQKLEYFSV